METTMNGRWATPAIGLVLGGLLFAASAIGGQPVLGAAMFAVMAIWVAILVVLGGRSETIGVLAGRPADERLSMYSIHATAVAGIAAILVAMAGFLWAIAAGRERLGLRGRGGNGGHRLPRCHRLVPLARIRTVTSIFWAARER